MSVNQCLAKFALLLFFISPVLSAAPAIEHWTTAKGAEVYYVPTQGLPLVDIRLVFDAGSARDDSQLGLAAMTSTVLDTGAADWNADAIAERLDGVGAQMGTGVSAIWPGCRSEA